MATQPPSEEGRPVPETVMRQSVLNQAQAAAAAAAAEETDSAGPTRQEALLQVTDLVTPDAAEDDVPPPAYGDIYGEIRAEKDGLGTSASVTDDGRVNIRINQLNRRLSQIFTPALRQQIQSVQDSGPSPPAYIPPSLGGEEGVPPPPPLNVVIQVVGSRGDVQPFVALGKVLRDTYGHRVRLATHPTFKDFVQENGLEFFSIGGDPSQLMAFMVKNPGLMPGFRSLMSGDVGQRRRDVAEYIQGCWRSCYKAGDGMSLRAADDDDLSGPAARPFVADCIIANPPSFAHIHCAEKLGIPLHIMFTMPYSPTQAFPHPLANIQSSNADPQLTNFISYTMIELLSWQGLGDIINRFRKKCLGLEPVSVIWGPGMLQRLKIPHTYCWSPALIPKPKDWGPNISISGFYFLSSSDYTPAPDLQAFLDAGPIPVYIGFGSIVLDDPNAMTELIFEAVRKTGQRVLLSKGWGGIGADHIPDGVFMLGNVPHDWLFKHVSCVVHHGGAGTTAAGISAGRPTVVVPFFGDQPFWGAMVARAGAGPDPIPIKQLTADRLTDAINFCLKPESLERAKQLASKIAAERGSDTGAQSFHQYLEPDRLRCTLAPSRPATWRIKRTQIRLSAFAACTLANANLLDFHDLKLFRPQEYNTDEGPWDPISGGFAACLRAFGGMAMGIADFPSETLKAFQIQSGSSRQQSQASVSESSRQQSQVSVSESSRQQSQASVSTITRKPVPSSVGERSTPPTSPGQSQSSLSAQEPLARGRSPSNLSDSPSLPSNIESSSMSDALQGRSNPKADAANQSRVRSRVESSPDKDQDMLRRRGVHTSKGLGRVVKAAVQAPMEISVNMTKGFHNAPKLWGDDTVRPQEQVSDFKSGLKAVGREFGYGWYDGVTGMVTQPWKGAQKEGTAGFFKGFGKGIGGFVAKPSAALFGVLGHTMKGVQKEVQKLFGSNVQSYILASRAAQGYEEWLQSSDVEKEDVIARWKLVQKYLKAKGDTDEMLRDVLDAQRKTNTQDREARQNAGRTMGSARSAASAAASIQDFESMTLVTDRSQSPLSPADTTHEGSPRAADVDETIRPSVQRTSLGDAEEDPDVFRAIQENVSQLQRRRQEAADHQEARENLRHVNETSEYDSRPERVVVQSPREQGREVSDSGSESVLNFDDDEYTESVRAGGIPEQTAEKVPAVASGSQSVQQAPSYDPGHLAGTTQSEFEAHRQGGQVEKTTQEKTEEEIVMEYVRKQSILEAHHQQNKGKARATATEDEDDEDLQKALKLSMQEHGVRRGEASGM